LEKLCKEEDCLRFEYEMDFGVDGASGEGGKARMVENKLMEKRGLSYVKARG